MEKYLLLYFLILAFLPLSCLGQIDPVPPAVPNFLNAWQEVKQLQDEQKYSEAATKVEQIYEKAKAEQNQSEWTKSFMQLIALKRGLHSYETAVRFMMENAWPTEAKYKALVHLFYANTLMDYYNNYSWEINQREKVVSQKGVDLKKWTAYDIFEEINHQYSESYQYREVLGTLKVTEFPEYFNRNGYPENIAATCYDFLVAQWVQFLANTNTWKPIELKEKYLLDFSMLVNHPSQRQTQAEEFFSNIKNHPILRMVNLLDNLYRWNLNQKLEESALESQLLRFKYLSPIFVNSEQLQILIDKLQELLNGYSQYSWWSAGQYQYAILLQRKNDLVASHEAAMNGYERYPQSLGGKKCLHLARSIEAPALEIESMSLDRPGVSSIRVSYKNLTKVYFRAYHTNFDKWLNRKQHWPGSIESEYIEKIMGNKIAASWDIDLQECHDYQMHSAYSNTPASLEHGFYLIIASVNKNFSKNQNKLTAQYLMLSDLVTTLHQREKGWEVFVTHGTNGTPVADANVILYQYDYDRGMKKIREAQTGITGSVVFKNSERSNLFLVVKKDKQISWDSNDIYLNQWYSEPQMRGCFIYTDRSIYRPLQKLYVKVVTYQGYNTTGKYSVLAKKPLKINFADPNGKEISSLNLITNDYGTASGEFEIPSGRVLGQYSLEAISESATGYSTIRVEEYKRPTFEVKLDKPKEALRLNDIAKITGQAMYYFGLPVTAGKINYRVTRAPIWPWWYWWFYPRQDESRYTYEIAAGQTTLDAEGKFTVPFTPKADPSLKNKDIYYNFKIAVEITDEGGETRTSDSTYPIGFVAVKANYGLPYNFFVPEDNVNITLTRTDLSDVPQAGQGHYRLVKLQQPDEVLTPEKFPVMITEGQKVSDGDTKRPRWEENKELAEYLYAFKSGELIQEGKLSHDAEGKAIATLGKLAAGAYRLYYSTKDRWESEYITQKEFIVASDNLRLNIPFFLLTRQSHYKVGETALIFYGSGFDNQNFYLEYQQNIKLLRHTAKTRTQLEEIPITKELRGGFSLRLWAIQDYRFYNQEENIYIPWNNKDLKITFSSFRNLLQPGQKETWTVNIAGPKSEKMAAEILAYMYDRSLDFFVPHSYPQLSSLYPYKTGLISVDSNLSMQQFSMLDYYDWYELPGFTEWSEDSFILYDSYPIGGLGYRHRRYYDMAMDGAGAVEEDYKADESPKMEKKEKSKNGKEPPAPSETSISTNDTTTSKLPEKPERSPAQETNTVRSNFAETAFFQPHLIPDANGNVQIQFQIPDSVTSWNLYVHALTKDLCFMTEKREVITRKNLMIRPYLPRFFREGDAGILKVMVNNATDEAMEGTVNIAILDADTQEDKTKEFGITTLEQPWKMAGKGSTTVSWALQAPHGIRTYIFKIIGKAKDYQDGELRPLPVLPSRIHLVQSKFITLKENQTKTMYLADLEKSLEDDTLIHQSLVVTVDAQLLYSVLQALPYLTQYPYECVEQTLNRFLCTGMVSSLYEQYPAIAKMAQDFSKRQTQLQAWNKEDANRKMTLEETPWLNLSEGGHNDMANLINVLDPKIAKAQREDSLQKLQKAQYGDGAFPWWAGGPPSPYITLYMLHGFAKAQEFKIDIPPEMIRNAWGYVGKHIHSEANWLHPDNYYFLTFLNYVLSCYKDVSLYEHAFSQDERQQMLNFAFANWKKMCPYLKAYLSLTLHRMDRSKDAKLVLESIMDSAITREDEGTFWAAEDRSWLWYNDSIESHAFTLRCLAEVKPEDEKNTDGMILWLLLNKKCNQWKSTRATAEVIYTLVYILDRQNALGKKETCSLTIGPKTQELVFEPDSYTGAHRQFVTSAKEINPKTMAKVKVSKTGPGYMFASMAWHYSTEKMPTEERGDFLKISRKYFLRKHEGSEYVLKPLEDITTILAVGDQVEVHVSISSKHQMEYVHLRDPRAAGFEPETTLSGHKWDLGIYWYEEVRDSGTNFFFEWLPQGEYNFTYRLRATMAGEFRVGPATIQGMYAPEFTAFSTGQVITIK